MEPIKKQIASSFIHFNSKKLILFLIFVLIFPLLGVSQTLDYRPYQSSVKHQENRGTCTAFAVVAALETFSGFPIDLSEQYIYAMVKLNYYDEIPVYGEGAHLYFYIDVIQKYGTIREDQEPYNPNSVLWDTATTNFELMKRDLGGSRVVELLYPQPITYKLHPDMYQYRVGADAQDIDWIKQRLDDGIKTIPVAYDVSSYYWYIKGNQDAVMDPSEFLYVNDGTNKYTYAQAIEQFGEDNVIQQLNQGKMESEFSDSLFQTNQGHAVAICGYTEKGFLIKNSWGTDWGDDGYCLVTYDYHKLYANELLLPSMGMVDVKEWLIKPAPVDPGKLKLKSIPVEYKASSFNKASKRIRLSVVYYGDEQIPEFSEIVYEVYDKDGNKIYETYGNTSGIYDGKHTGYDADIIGENNQYPIVYRLTASFTTKSGQKFQNTYTDIKAMNKEYSAVEQ